MFSAGNTKEKVNIDEDIIDAEDYLDDNMARDNNLSIDWKSADIKSQNHEKNAETFFEELFTNAYENNKLIQAIIDEKVGGMRKLLCKILKQVKLSMGNLEVKNIRLYLGGNIYVSDDKNL